MAGLAAYWPLAHGLPRGGFAPGALPCPPVPARCRACSSRAPPKEFLFLTLLLFLRRTPPPASQEQLPARPPSAAHSATHPTCAVPSHRAGAGRGTAPTPPVASQDHHPFRSDGGGLSFRGTGGIPPLTQVIFFLREEVTHARDISTGRSHHFHSGSWLPYRRRSLAFDQNRRPPTRNKGRYTTPESQHHSANHNQTRTLTRKEIPNGKTNRPTLQLRSFR